MSGFDDLIIKEYLSTVTTFEEFTMIKNMIDVSRGEVSPIEFLRYKTKDNTWQDVIWIICDSWGTGDYKDFIDYMRAEGADPFYTED